MGAFVSERIPVEPRILRWAREFAGLPEEEAARRIGVSAEKLSDWEEGVSSPTINQLRTMADRYRLSFGVFLLRQPPARKFIPPHDFRRVQGPPLPRSIELMTQLRLAVERRQLALDIYEALDEAPPVFSISTDMRADPDELATKLRAALGADMSQQESWRTTQKALSAWKDKFEQAGILVGQFSGIDRDEARGASIAEYPLPVAIVNSKDAPAARIFTLFHELAHIALRKSGLCDIDENLVRPPSEQAVEVFCNRIAAATLVPAADFLSDPVVEKHNRDVMTWGDSEIDSLARRFAVSRFVVLRRLLSFNRTSQDFYSAKHVEWSAEAAMIAATQLEKDTIVPPYRKALAATGKQFARLILRAYYGDHLTLSDVSEHLRLKVKHIPNLEREAFG